MTTQRARDIPGPFQSGGAERDRTADLYVANVPLSQLSYCPIVMAHPQAGRPSARIYSITLAGGKEFGTTVQPRYPRRGARPMQSLQFRTRYQTENNRSHHRSSVAPDGPAPRRLRDSRTSSSSRSSTAMYRTESPFKSTATTEVRASPVGHTALPGKRPAAAFLVLMLSAKHRGAT